MSNQFAENNLRNYVPALEQGFPLLLADLDPTGASDGNVIVYSASDGTWEYGSGVLLSLPITLTDSVSTTGNSFGIVATTMTSGVVFGAEANALTAGAVFEALANAGTLTTGRYFNANDGTTDVWGIGANGHIHSNQTTAPTIAVGTANGITAAAVTAGSSDTAGNITTTGTNAGTGATVLNVTFNKTYTAAPKVVQINGTNAAGSKAAATSLELPYVSAKSATGFSITIPSDASAGATPSFSYVVIA